MDLITISLVEETKAIREELTRLSEVRICSLAELFADMKNDGGTVVKSLL